MPEGRGRSSTDSRWSTGSGRPRAPVVHRLRRPPRRRRRLDTRCPPLDGKPHEPARSARRRRQGPRPRGSDHGGRGRQPHARRPRRSPGGPPLLGRRPGPRDRPHRARGHGDRPRGGGPGGGAALAAAARGHRGVPLLGDAAARAPQPPQRHRRPAPRRAAPPRPPPRRRPRDRPGLRRRRTRAIRAPAAGQGPRRPGARGPAHRSERRSERRGGGPRGRRLRTGRAGGEARRVRRARRHPGRVPAHRGTPPAHRVLGRRRRGDPLLQGRRPALPGDRRARAVGAALPRAAAHRPGAGTGADPRRGTPRAGRTPEQDRRGHRGRGHGVPRPGPGGRHGAAARRAAPGLDGRGLRPRAGPHPRRRPGGHQPGVPPGVVGRHRRWWRGPDRRRRGLPVVHRRRPRPGARAGHDVVVRVALRGR
ncbi:hypothetical protein SGPA1_51000 [Streptomyces misionensis JCM 4497]